MSGALDPSDWRRAEALWNEEAGRAAEAAAEETRMDGRVPARWWEEAFADRPTPSEASGHRCGAKHMLVLVAYDIADPKRLTHVARHCKDFGVRVQYSVFECLIEAGRFEELWQDLNDLIDPSEDRLVAYRICAECARQIYCAGRMETTSGRKQVAYVF
jgi:CRISPR-associated protein Cas2